jgi:hypothetical protein
MAPHWVISSVEKLPYIAERVTALGVIVTPFILAWKWLLSHRDKKVLKYFEDYERRRKMRRSPGTLCNLPSTPGIIAGSINRSVKSVVSSLSRLRKQGRVEEVPDGWILIVERAKERKFSPRLQGRFHQARF